MNPGVEVIGDRKNNPLRYNQRARYWWLTPAILATQEAEIRRITVRSQPWANS
jgi:hypothetical protein